MTFMRQLCVTICLICLPTLGFADTLTCKIKKERSTGGVIPLEFQVTYDLDAGTSNTKSVYRGKLVAFDGSAVGGKSNRITVKYVAEDLFNNPKQPLGQMVYRIFYFSDSNRVSVHAKPLGYSNWFKGKGACKRT